CEGVCYYAKLAAHYYVKLTTRYWSIPNLEEVEEELPSELEGDFSGQFEPETVLATRTVKQGTENVIQVMVQ
ncbi:hypothetical protein A2U01_0038520, partial [Trifolium medium]|nr:hypothetical protein [Trifolium medium]